MANNYVLLDRIELNATTASVTFDNIPQSGYTDLKVVVSSRLNNTDSPIKVNFNGVTTGYSWRRIYGNGSSASSLSGSDAYYLHGDTSSMTANTFSNSEFYVPNYTSSTYKSISVDTALETNATGGELFMLAALWSNNAAIFSINMTPLTGSFVANSTFSLYGVAALGTTPAIAPKANGGNVIATDGTYWYHAFLSNGTFTPQVALTCDYLVVAGGGSGGSYAGGGGGAGGYRTGTGLAVSTATAVTVGAGATGTVGTVGTQGSSSTFSSITSAGGGAGGGTSFSGPGGAGGSGGGSSGANGTTNAGGAATPAGQGFAGGGASSGGVSAAAGGGGAGAVGGSTTGVVGGAGGVGLNTLSTWATATGTGVSGYYAGGGGAGADTAGGQTAGAGGAGGGGAGALTAAVAGTANSGGGGGGNWNPAYAGASGGSGIIIIRYPVAS